MTIDPAVGTVGEVPAQPDGPEAESQHARASREARAGRKAARRAAKAAKREAKAATRAAKRAGKAARQAAKAARKAERRAADAAAIDARAKKDRERRERKAARQQAAVAPAPGATPAPRLGERLSGAAAAGSMLEEVADLVRQAAEPAASRIVQRVIERAVPEPEAPEPHVEVEAGMAPDTGGTAVTVELEPEADPAQPAASEPAFEPFAPEVEVTPDKPVEANVPAEPDEPVTPVTPAEPDAEPPVVIPPDAVIGAAVDVGSNSVHLLVAAVDGRRVIPLVDESVFLGLGDRVAAHGTLGAAAREELALALATYAETARRLGARDITFLGTEPIRRAADAAALVREVAVASGVAVHVLDHHEEAILNLLGVTMGGEIDHDMLVVDIGGGSSEVIVAGPGRRVATVGLRTGSARLTRDHLRDDPPTPDEVRAMREAARRVVAGTPVVSPAELIAVGGTASNLVRVLGEAAADGNLTHDRISTALALLAAEPSADIASRHLLRPTRARILPAGAVILDAILERCGADRIFVVDTGIREGAVLAGAVAGPSWRDRLEALATGRSG